MKSYGAFSAILALLHENPPPWYLVEGKLFKINIFGPHTVSVSTRWPCDGVMGYCARPSSPIHYQQIEDETKGRPFFRRHFQLHFFNENVRISITIPLKFVPKGPINNIPALVQMMAWRRSGDKPLYEPMMVNLLTHVCVTRPQWVNGYACHGCLVIVWHC